MAITLATMNVRGLRDPSRASAFLQDLRAHHVDVAAVQETHFVCEADGRLIANDFIVHSSYGDRDSRGVSLLVKRTLGAAVNIIHSGIDGRLLVADIAVGDDAFRVVAVYAPNIAAMRRLYLQRLEEFLTDSKRLVLMGDWNAILDPEIDSGTSRGVTGAGLTREKAARATATSAD